MGARAGKRLWPTKSSPAWTSSGSPSSPWIRSIRFSPKSSICKLQGTNITLIIQVLLLFNISPLIDRWSVNLAILKHHTECIRCMGKLTLACCFDFVNKLHITNDMSPKEHLQLVQSDPKIPIYLTFTKIVFKSKMHSVSLKQIRY